MKKYFVIAAMVFGGACKAQSPIYPLFGNSDNNNIAGAYYKDTYNDFDNFTGRWEYVSGSTSLKVILQKRIQHHNSYGNFYEDLIIGGYRYVENGVEKVNTLNQLSTNDPEVYNYVIVGNTINKTSNFPVCFECPSNQKRLILSFEDPTRQQLGLEGRIILRRVDSGGIQKIELWLWQVGNIITVGNAPAVHTSFNVPWGKYILTKVN